jgi:L-alanine-DL-glutamate epimerase-like enolase superfamily enzyme
MNAPAIKVGEARFGIDNAFARMPFRFGVVTMEAAAALTLELELSVDGRRAVGYASDLLAYKWFDKRPEKTPADNVADLLLTVQEAARVARDLPAGTMFDIWRALDVEVERLALAAGFNRLGASFGVSMIERALIDGIGRALGLTFHDVVRDDVLGLRPAQIFPELDGMSLTEVLPRTPLARLGLRHTVGLVDPIDAGDLDPADSVGDGLPETLADYLREDGVRYLKIKVSGDAEADLARLERIAALLAGLGGSFAITLDGNEQYKRLDDFAGLMEAIRSRPALDALYRSILFVEQPLERSVALDAPLGAGALAAIGKPLLIDEADGWTGAFREAIALGYRGVSHKNCKGVVRSLLNAMLVARHNAASGEPGGYFQSAEDLTCLPVVSLQADLAVVASLGIGHVERNGHHYFHGLDHLPRAEADAALKAHPDLYAPLGKGAQLAVRDGHLDIASLQVPGLGCAVSPDLGKRIAPADWTFAMLNARPAD